MKVVCSSMLKDTQTPLNVYELKSKIKALYKNLHGVILLAPYVLGSVWMFTLHFRFVTVSSVSIIAEVGGSIRFGPSVAIRVWFSKQKFHRQGIWRLVLQWEGILVKISEHLDLFVLNTLSKLGSNYFIWTHSEPSISNFFFLYSKRDFI